ncbi:FAD-dependent oxidoreductase [Salimicrobium halophilum]|uniref:NADH dehydrogenase, FAD-containing subunit n=1 Tax=Salimicrobium halophilum TaxID=86666 RepID=A0A1G8R3B9_9BACI|nr:FAD-dependent oxidoreductase [Salimicrobium halophilum]SDJ11459.1 NADH dehydrogenase, FAD-containing subunit [Salimicrobium halophilum]
MNRLLLIGGGHANVYILDALRKESVDMEVTMVSPSRYQYYSGMFSGFTEGLYEKEDIRIDLRRLAEDGGGSFIEGEVTHVDPQRKEVKVGEDTIRFDLVSFDTGSLVKEPNHLQEDVYSVKPNYVFPENIDHLKRTREPVIVGGGAAGVELAFSMLAWRKKHQVHQRVTLIHSSHLLEEFGKKASRKAEELAAEKGISVITGERVTDVDKEVLWTDSDRRVSHTGVLWLAGAEAPPLYEKSGIKTDQDGFMLVNDQLQSVSHPSLFGAGDCVSFLKNRVPKNGVYAIRQAPVLWENLKRKCKDEPLSSFRPQRTYMAILSTGQKEGLLSYGGLVLHHRLCFRLKHFIDSRFIKNYET